jgi:hypothetical protein
MTTIPNNVNPTIPDRSDAKAFAAYAASVMQAFAEGKPIAVTASNNLSTWVSLVGIPPSWDWRTGNYAIIPEPAPPTYRWPTDEEWCKRFTDLRWQAVLVKHAEGGHATGQAAHCGNGWFVSHHGNMSNICSNNWQRYTISLDGGKTWRSVGIQESGVDE